MSRKSIQAVYEEVKERDNRIKRDGGSRYNKCLNNQEVSACDLVIDDDYEDNVLLTNKKKQKGMRLCDEPLNLTCIWGPCMETFEVSNLFTDHLLEHGYNAEVNEFGNYVCENIYCNFENESLDQLIKHISFHAYHERLKNYGESVTERYKLTKCTQPNFELPSIIFNYSCEWDNCEQIFSVLHEFLLHVRIHVNRNPKYCKKGEFIQCGWIGCCSKFSTQYKLTDHVRMHTKEKTIACPTCGNMFSSKTKFIDHRKRQTPIELHSYQCSECSKLWPTERLLRTHMRSHINHYKCSMCDMTCQKPSTLANHIRFRHLDVRPFKCNLCDHACVSKGNLEQHLTTHCAENLMTCEDCDFSCRSFYGLERHYLNEHAEGTAIPLYECHCCQKRFNRGGHLTNHLIKTHEFSWPSGHSRFRYKEDCDGFFRLQTVRYESLEVTKEMMSNKPTITNNVTHELTKDSDNKYSFTIKVSECKENNSEALDNQDIIITIDDVDSRGRVINTQVVESKEMYTTSFLELDPITIKAESD